MKLVALFVCSIFFSLLFHLISFICIFLDGHCCYCSLIFSLRFSSPPPSSPVTQSLGINRLFYQSSPFWHPTSLQLVCRYCNGFSLLILTACLLCAHFHSARFALSDRQTTTGPRRTNTYTIAVSFSLLGCTFAVIRSV